jgi:hypothetical protein
MEERPGGRGFAGDLGWRRQDEDFRREAQLRDRLSRERGNYGGARGPREEELQDNRKGRTQEGSFSTGLATKLIRTAQSLGKEVRSRFTTAWVEMEEVV